MAHLACEQFVGFLGLLALRDVQKDAEHNSTRYVGVVALAPGGNPSNVILEQDSKIDFIRANDSACGGECRPHAF